MSNQHRFPQNDYEPVSEHGGFRLCARFIPHLQDKTAARFYVWAYNEDRVSFTEMATVPTVKFKNDPARVEQELFDFVLERAKARIDSGDFENEGRYEHRLRDGV